MKASRFFILTSLTLLLVPFSSTLADVPQTLMYQGRLTTGAGAPVADGAYLIQFRIYNAASGGAVLWDNGYRTVMVVNGLFSYNLGDSVALPNDLFEDTARWLGTKVGADVEIAPRVKLGAVAYAYHALRADTASFAHVVAPNSIDSSDIADGAIGATDILDEPGIVYYDVPSAGDTVEDENGGWTIMAVDTIHCPTSGYVLAIANFVASAYHVQGNADNQLTLGIAADATPNPPGQVTWFLQAPELPTGNYQQPLSLSKVFEVSAGANDFYFIVTADGGPTDLIWWGHPNLVLLFIPSLYEE